MTLLLVLVAWLSHARPAFSEIRYVASEAPPLSRLNLHVNGVTYHFSADRDELNEFNYGLGCSYKLGHFASEGSFLDRTVLTLEGEVYSDSFSQLGAAAGIAWQKRIGRFFDFGLRAGLIHEENLRRKIGSPVAPYLLPFIETRFGGMVDARITLVPPIGKKTGGFIAGQLILRLW